MLQHRRFTKLIITIVIFAFVVVTIPLRASGEVGQVTDIKDKLSNISEEEKAVLEELFTLEQEINDLELEEKQINNEMDDLKTQITGLQKEIDQKQADYDTQLDILKKVLVQYQRGGPASYLEILFSADNLSMFLKSLNIMKDISHNVNELLASLEEGRKQLQAEKDQLDGKTLLLEQKKEELLGNIQAKQNLQEEQENYLASLKEDRAFYEEQLNSVTQMWEDCSKLFPDISKEISDIIGAGYFTLEDLNLTYHLFDISGYLKEETFNRILSDNSKLPKTEFHYKDGQVTIEVPDEHLVLSGNFVISGESAIEFQADSGTFYDMPLEASSIVELFQNGPLLIDFQSITGEVFIIDFKITDVESQNGSLNFVIIPQF